MSTTLSVCKMMKDNNDGKGETPPSPHNTEQGQSYAKAVQKTMTKTPLGSEKSGNDQNPTSLMTETRKINDTVTPKGAKSIVQKYRIVSSAKTRIRLENEADLVKLVAEIIAVYMTHDKGHNKSSCNL